ncbi:MAG: sulfite exporter TauE/SafE family protein [Hyphomicrobiales bacterium]|nr:sulfite exporter TauE/SafE family protein [Hyphomicrobiales bacterium]MCY4054179.1 sulfite exporter TauE/SafE family protein [Hyphomicrobiales bacterium]
MDGALAYIVAVSGGLLSFFSPCVLPLVPGYLCFLAGVSLKDAQASSSGEAHTLKLLAVAAFFVLGFSSVFISLGAGAAAIHPWLLAHSPWLSKLAGAVVFLFGIHYIGLLRLPWLEREWSSNFAGRANMSAPVFAYVAGLAFGFGWTPCIGPILATILVIAASQTSLAHGVSLLAAYSLGLGVPFLFAAILLPGFLNASKKVRAYFSLLRMGAGGLLAATGVAIFTGGLERFAWWSLELFPWLGELG